MTLKTFIIFLMLLSAKLSASVMVDVSVPIHPSNKELTLQNAKTKAAKQAIGELPSIIWGSQSLSNEVYHEEIRAIGFAQAHVEIKDESWNYTDKKLTIKANVSWDHEKIMSILNDVKQGQDAKKYVKQIETILQGINASDFIDSSAYNKHIEARLLASPYYLGMDIGTYSERYIATLEQMKRIKFERTIHFIELTTYEPKGIKNNFLGYEVTFPSPEILNLKFNSEDLQKFYIDNKAEIETVTICSEPSYQSKENIPNQLNIRTIETGSIFIEFKLTDYVVNSFQAGVKPLYLYPCETKAL